MTIACPLSPHQAAEVLDELRRKLEGTLSNDEWHALVEAMFVLRRAPKAANG